MRSRQKRDPELIDARRICHELGAAAGSADPGPVAAGASDAAEAPLHQLRAAAPEATTGLCPSGAGVRGDDAAEEWRGQGCSAGTSPCHCRASAAGWLRLTASRHRRYSGRSRCRDGRRPAVGRGGLRERDERSRYLARICARYCLLATATVLEFPPIGSSHAPTSCLCSGRNGSGHMAHTCCRNGRTGEVSRTRRFGPQLSCSPASSSWRAWIAWWRAAVAPMALVSSAGCGGFAGGPASFDRHDELALELPEPVDHDSLFGPAACAATVRVSSCWRQLRLRE